MAEDTPQGQGISLADLLKDYDYRKKEGHIYWTNENGFAILNIKQFDISLKETQQPIKMQFSSSQVDEINLDYDTRIIEFKRQAIQIQGQIERLEKEKQAVYALIADDVKAAEKGEKEK